MNKKHLTIYKFSLKLLAFIGCFIIISCSCFGQQKYWVYFTDKDGVTFNPYEYFNAKAIERREKLGISLYDNTDFPLQENYINSVSSIVESISKSSRWFNAVAVVATNEQISKVKSLPFVKDVEEMLSQATLALYDTSLIANLTDLLGKQTAVMGGQDFINNNINGKGIRIAIFDAGFPSVDISPAFEHIRKENRIIATWDFTKNKDFVYAYNTHGTMVLSCIAGIINGKQMGLATGAEFLLARTEVNSEPFSEEENWLAAVEWADKNGADIINSSLGYTYQRYFTKNMDGKTSLVARAANLAARKGILVVNAAGNDGDSKWSTIGTPADADSVLSIGGISPYTYYHINFSSYGPTADKRMKPNVCSLGTAVVTGSKKIQSADGTSFASPLVAGFAACAWQTNRNLTNMELFKEIEKSGNLYPYYDYAHGYGVPQANYFTNKNKQAQDKTFDVEINNENNSLKVIVKEEYIKCNTDKNNLLYYHIENKSGVLDSYKVISVSQKEALNIPIKEYNNGEKLRIYYKGYIYEHQF